jgi:hypothetical protein
VDYNQSLKCKQSEQLDPNLPKLKILNNSKHTILLLILILLFQVKVRLIKQTTLDLRR